jgi:hypothetical protein
MPLVLSCPPAADRWSLCKAQTPMVYSGMDAGVDHGDRYWSRILEGEPEGAGVEESAAKDSPHRRGAATGVRPCWMGRAGNPCFFLPPPFPPPPPPG